MLHIILDIFMVAVIVISAMIAAKKGFVKVFLNLIGVFVALFLAMQFCVPSAEFIYDKFLEKNIYNGVYTAVGEYAEQGIDAVYNNLPPSVLNAAEKIGIDLDNIISKHMSAGTDNLAEKIAGDVSHSIVRPFSVKIISGIVFIILFILSLVLIKIVIRALNLVTKLPGLHAANKTLGIIMGILQGLCICVIICFMLNISASLFENGVFGYTEDILNQSVAYKMYNFINPFK